MEAWKRVCSRVDMEVNRHVAVKGCKACMLTLGHGGIEAWNRTGVLGVYADVWAWRHRGTEAYRHVGVYADVWA